ncbi:MULTISPECIES: BrxA family protein [unclassified Anaeromyxobacter]|uniref:BrxA family protein n=1 Tax=unclassified Anaeromyxobacter TaxID=2620896 RepID=UPI001F565115|nr:MULTISPECIES: BrxA family protein [unclassified Anaeromyxobacter]
MISKGAMISETYAVFQSWSFEVPKAANLARLRAENFIGAKSAVWVDQVAKVLNRRFDPEGRDRPLVILAKRNCSIEVWKPILLWHMTRDEFLVRDFLVNWLYPAFDKGAFRVKPEDLFPFLRAIESRGGQVEGDWSENTIKRVAAGLLKIAVDFGLLKGSGVKEVTTYHLPEEALLYVLHALRERTESAQSILASEEWRMFLLRRDDLERELLHLHQFRKVEYHVAGSLAQLTLPCGSVLEYAQRMVV